MIHFHSAVPMSKVVHVVFESEPSQPQNSFETNYVVGRDLLLELMQAKLGACTPGEARVISSFRQWVKQSAQESMKGSCRAKNEAYIYSNFNTGVTIVFIAMYDDHVSPGGINLLYARQHLLDK
jgi:hypothetical protein